MNEVQENIRKLRELMEGLPGRAAEGLSRAEGAFGQGAVRKASVGEALEEAVELAKEEETFGEMLDEAEPHVRAVVAWLGPDWQHVVNLFRSKELGRKYPVLIEPYNPDWPRRYEDEAWFLGRRFGPDLVLRTEHFGSTAVPGLAAKPVIDVLVEVAGFERAQAVIVPALEEAGYAYNWVSRPEPGHMMFMKGYGADGYVAGAQLYHLHMAPAGHPLWERLRFRDYLRAHPETAAEYGALKQRLAVQHRHDREAYTAAKGAFIRDVMERA